MAKTIKKHWDLVLVGGIGLTLAIIGVLIMSGMIGMPSSVSAATTATATVDVSATVAETIEITASSGAMSLGTLSSGSVSATSNNFTVKTNAAGGYTVNLKDKDYSPTSSDPGLHKLTAPASTIASASTTLSPGTAGYGAQGTTTDSDVTIAPAYNKTGDAVGKIEVTSAQNFASSSSPTLGDQSTLTLKATISTITVAGAYQDQLTLTAVGTF